MTTARIPLSIQNVFYVRVLYYSNQVKEMILPTFYYHEQSVSYMLLHCYKHDQL